MSSEPGFSDALRRLAGTAFTMLQSRLELASLEMGAARQRFLVSAMYGLFAVLMLVVGAVALSVCVVLLLWDQMGVLALAAMGLIYLAGGFMLIAKVKSHLASQPRLLEATNAELQRDAAMLRGSPAGGDR